ncbi:hypothetical protein Golob_022718, partial [Gossypium lobatum]|nr:hypothetical protein [Gossypium lobatum]
MIEPYLEVAGFLHVSLMLKAVNWIPHLLACCSVHQWMSQSLQDQWSLTIGATF